MSWSEFGTLIDDLRKKKQAHGAIDTLNKEMGAHGQYTGAKQRTDDWLRSLSPEELSKLSPQTKQVPSDFESVGDVKHFDFDTRSRDLGLTSKFSGVEGVSDYIKSVNTQKANKESQAVKTSLEDANKGMQREKQFADLNALEEKVGAPKGDYNLRTNRQVAIDTGMPQSSGDPKIKDFMETYVEGPEKDALTKEKEGKKSIGGGANVWSQKDFKYRTIPEALPRLRKDLDEALELGIIDEYTHSNLRGVTETDPASVELRLAKYIDNPNIAAKTINASTAPKANQTSALTAARENTQRSIQAKNPILTENQGGALGDAYNAVGYLNSLKSALAKGDLGYFDVDRKTGQFVNPKAGDAFNQLVEIVGRKRSGAAISESEWKNFGKQVLNKNNLLTEAGKKTALESLDRYIDKFFGAGVTTTGNEDWYNNYKSKTTTARSKAGFTDEPKPSTTNAPAVGTVKNGYRFKGGKPSDPNSWEKVK